MLQFKFLVNYSIELIQTFIELHISFHPLEPLDHEFRNRYCASPSPTPKLRPSHGTKMNNLRAPSMSSISISSPHHVISNPLSPHLQTVPIESKKTALKEQKKERN